MKIDNSPARGMRDLLPADVAVRDHVLESISAVYRRFGYQRIETPALEHIDRLSSGEGGDNEKLIFEVLRRGLRRMAGEVLSDRSPAMQLLDEMNAAEWPADTPTDAGLHHDRYLADAAYPGPKRKRRRK